MSKDGKIKWDENDKLADRIAQTQARPYGVMQIQGQCGGNLLMSGNGSYEEGQLKKASAEYPTLKSKDAADAQYVFRQVDFLRRSMQNGGSTKGHAITLKNDRSTGAMALSACEHSVASLVAQRHSASQGLEEGKSMRVLAGAGVLGKRLFFQDPFGGRNFREGFARNKRQKKPLQF